jgi:hypothetical protein
MNIFAGFSRAAACAVLALLTTVSAFAADPAIRKKGERATFTGSSFGQLVTKLADDDMVTGTFDNDGTLKVKGNMDNPTYVGVWTASTAPKECDEEKEGSSYWGNVTFAMSDAGRTYTGKWGYCDAEPDTNFQAKWDGK